MATAARSLGIDATTVIRRLNRLTRALGSELFDRQNGERVLTDRGEALMRHAETIESETLALAQDVAGQRLAYAGQVRLSVAEGFGTAILSPGLPAFHARHPGIQLDLITASGFLNLSKREADVAVMLARPQHGQLMIRRLAEYRLHLYAAPAYLERCGVPNGRADLHRHSLIGYVPEFLFSPELDYLDEIEPGLSAKLRSSSINIQRRIVTEGGGIGVLPDFLVRGDASLVRVLPGEVEIVRSFWLVTHRDVRSLARIAAVVEWLDEQVSAALRPDAT